MSSFTRALAPLHKEYGIKVVAIAPCMVMTPLWTNHPDQFKAVDQKQDVILSPEEMAEAMLMLVESGDYEGGSVLEVLKGKTRLVKIDSEVPNGEGATMSNMGLITEETLTLLDREMRA